MRKANFVVETLSQKSHFLVVSLAVKEWEILEAPVEFDLEVIEESDFVYL